MQTVTHPAVSPPSPHHAGQRAVQGFRADRRVRVDAGTRTQYGSRDGSGEHQVAKRLEQQARRDRTLSAHLQALADAILDVKS
jgi:hypothetical protein